MTAPAPTMPPASRIVSWFITSDIIGWLVAYNVLRITGRTPRDAAIVAIAPGIVLGLAFVALTILAWRKGLGRHQEIAIPAPEALDAPSRDALRLAAFGMGALAVVALAVGVILGLDWNDTVSDQRSTAKIVTAGWDIFAGLWIASEIPRVARGHADGLESVALGGVLTAILAGLAFSRGWIEPAQVVLVVASAIAAGTAHLALWRAAGGRGTPVAAGVAVVVCAAAIVLPVVL